jgi:hypothetical protein
MIESSLDLTTGVLPDGWIPSAGIIECNAGYGICSDGYPATYSNSLSPATIVLTAEEASTMKLHVEWVASEELSDWLKFYDGPNTSSPLITLMTGTTGDYSGTQAGLHYVQSTGNQITIEWDPDSSTNAAGWYIPTVNIYQEVEGGKGLLVGGNSAAGIRAGSLAPSKVMLGLEQVWPVNNLLAHYKMNTDGTDFSGNGLNGTDYNLTYTGNSGVFSGVESGIDIPRVGLSPGRIKMAIWFNTDNISVDQCIFEYNDPVENCYYKIELSAGKVKATWGTALGTSSDTHAYVLSNNTWFMVGLSGFVAQNGLMHLYVNNSEAPTNSWTLSGGWQDTITAGRVIGRQTNTNVHFIGEISDAFFYDENSTLTMPEIYAAGR